MRERTVAATFQQVLTMVTEEPHGPIGLRAKAIGWSAEDPRHMAESGRVWGPHEHVGLVQSWPIGKPYSYASPLHAMGDGWRLFAPPTVEHDGTWHWWFVRETQSDG